MKDIRVTAMPPCDFHQARGVTVDGIYDTRTKYKGSWANLCQECYDHAGVEPTSRRVLRPADPPPQVTNIGVPLTYGAWMSECNRLMVARVGVGASDIEDWGWRDAYDDGIPPKDAVDGALEDSDIYGGSGL